MKILVINGSPKGKFSITLQTVKYLEKLYPEHEFSVLDAGQRIKALEKDFSAAVEAVEKAELIIFSYPVYTFVAPCQLHRFIELLKESGIDLSGKFVTQLSTSKHFYDITAHNYIRDNCFDLGMKYIKGLSADMDDLLSKKGQKEAREFFDYVCWNAENGFSETAPEKPSAPKNVPVSLPENSGAEKSGDVVIITDCEPENKQLSAMISRFCTVLPR
ncbi:MAG: NAD(P)H-dependent oxidoreductase, partial [Oscillospiraceae bacterium]|nr:NAD(P)H-dependent oxidoreductase [Oscillospiraceae bacterium]